MLKILSSLKKQPADVMSMLKLHQVDILGERESILSLASKNSYDVILLESRAFITQIKAIDPRAEVIVFGESKENVLSLINEGAYSYISYPVDLEQFRGILDSITEMVSRRNENARLEKQLYLQYTFFNKLVGKNPKMLDIVNLLKRIAPYYRIATINGETGTGKEIIAETLHFLSPVAKGPFIICDCGSLVETLSESELFGYKKGTFTGAATDKTGFFEAASGGTLFLDEIGELSLSMQTNLLRVLQSGEFRMIGNFSMQQANCRIVIATNRDLLYEVHAGRFREDLYYRISAIKIELPPLRERKDDLQLLTHFFLEQFSRRSGKTISGVSRPAQNILFSYDWPGNIRELENVLEEAAILTSESFIRKDDLPLSLKERTFKKSKPSLLLGSVIKDHIQEILTLSHGNRSKAAKLLGISRRTLIRKIKEYSLQ
jgi:DNA-binding NtrC family response regulator